LFLSKQTRRKEKKSVQVLSHFVSFFF